MSYAPVQTIFAKFRRNVGGTNVNHVKWATARRAYVLERAESSELTVRRRYTTRLYRAGLCAATFNDVKRARERKKATWTRKRRKK